MRIPEAGPIAEEDGVTVNGAELPASVVGGEGTVDEEIARPGDGIDHEAVVVEYGTGIEGQSGGSTEAGNGGGAELHQVGI